VCYFRSRVHGSGVISRLLHDRAHHGEVVFLEMKLHNLVPVEFLRIAGGGNAFADTKSHFLLTWNIFSCTIEMYKVLYEIRILH
jgi:hypothetical protein